MLEFNFTANIGSFKLNAAGCQCKPRTGLFGSSGCGKTTLLNCIAGLLRPQRGYIALNGETLFDHRKKIHVPAHKRSIGYVFQDKRLFPHMSVRANIEYGRKQGAAGPGLPELVEVLGVEHLIDRMPDTLSGGEYQRIALARTLAASPKLLLLDEPLASIDASAKLRILPYLKKAYEVWRIPYVYVSHSLSEILFLTDFAFEMHQGKIIQTVNPKELLARPSHDSESVLNIFEGTVEEIPESGGIAIVRGNGHSVEVPSKGLSLHENVSMGIPSNEILIANSPPQGISARNVLPARISRMENNGNSSWIVAESFVNQLIVEITEDAVRELELNVGKLVYVVFKCNSVKVTSQNREWN